MLRRKFPGNFLNGVICDRFDSSNEKGCINFNVLKATCGNGSIRIILRTVSMHCTGET